MAKRTCERCGVEYERPPSQLGRFCSRPCAYAASRLASPKVRRVRYDPKHPLANASGYVLESRAVLFNKVGPGPHECHWCGTEVRWTTGVGTECKDMLVTDHIDSDPHNNDPDNLATACVGCNATRGLVVRDDEPHKVRPNGSRLRGFPRTCETCKRDFVAWQETPGKGRFCSRSCARRAPRVVRSHVE